MGLGLGLGLVLGLGLGLGLPPSERMHRFIRPKHEAKMPG